MSSKLGVENIAHTNGTNAMTISSGGVVTSTNGINLGNEVLDSYREGTWTPTNGGSNVLTGAFTVSSAMYTKIGRLVSCNFKINKAGASGNWATTDYILLGGLPFTMDSQAYGSCTSAANFGNGVFSFFHLTGADAGDTTLFVNPPVTHGSTPRSNHLMGGFSYFTNQ